MGKTTKPGSAKNQDASSKDGEASDMAAAAPPVPLTVDVLVSELEKSRRSLSDEFTALLNASLSPFQSSLESIHSTLASHTTTISEMETALTDHSGRITELENEVTSLKAKLTAASDLNATLGSAVDDLVSRSKRQNLRVVGFPEGIEGRNPREFISDFFFKTVKDVLSAPPEIDRAHRSLAPKPRQGDRPRPFIVRFHRLLDKDSVLRWAKEHKELSYHGHTIKIYEDFSAGVARKCAAFNRVKTSLYKKGIQFGMIYPARLRITHNGEHVFDTLEAAERYLQEHIQDL
ncbi:hypothetical protein QQF64_022199 [Cirrhinus molitorella]|uniref:L1 transposable element RRM domain-containing protein n=1 Tax=Cirrhinus molitorella TaxID=172907 RepID=A0ABR3L9U5_9TELE